MSTEEIKKYLSEIGRKGGFSTAKKMSKEQRSERARLGGLAKARNLKKKNKSK